MAEMSPSPRVGMGIPPCTQNTCICNDDECEGEDTECICITQVSKTIRVHGVHRKAGYYI